MKLPLISAMTLLFSFLAAAPSWAHPHVFIYSSVDIVFDENGLAGFRVRWRFDEMFSSTIILDYDKNRNRRLEAPEIEGIKANAFSNLREFDYFCHVKINGEAFRVQYITGFTADIIEDQLVYQFFVPCHVRAIGTYKEVRLALYDQSFYTSMFLEENPVSCEQCEPFDIEYRVETNRDEAYYFSQIYPEEIILRFKTKND